MKRNKAEDRLRKLRWRAGAMGYEIVETQNGCRLAIRAPDASGPIQVISLIPTSMASSGG